MKNAFPKLEPSSYGERKFLSGISLARHPWLHILLVLVAIMFLALQIMKDTGDYHYLFLSLFHGFLALNFYQKHAGYKLLKRYFEDS